MQQTYTLIGFSLILLLVGLDCLPIEDASLQPARCRLSRPKSSASSECSDTERRYFFSETNIKGCKIFSLCIEDVRVHDNSTDEINYFQSFKDCQAVCMKHVSCPELPDVDNLEPFSNNGLQGWGRKVTHECAEGYSLADNSARSTRTCQKNGTWSGVTPVCLQQCPAPPEVDQAHIAPSNDLHNQGTTVHYTCNEGYKLEGSAQRTCSSNGEWDGSEPRCTCKAATGTGECLVCPGLSPINNGYLLAPNRSISAIAEYSCQPGFILIGNSTRECKESGEWSGEEPTCWNMAIIVRDNEDITNGTVVVEQGTANFKVTVKVPFNPFPDVVPRWTFNGENIPLDDDKDQLEPMGYTLVFLGILRNQEGTGSQEGVYAVHIEDYSASFTLETIAATQAIIEPNFELFKFHQEIPSATVGGTAEFMYVVKGCPIPDVRLYFEGEAVSSDRVEHTYTPHNNGDTLSLGSLTIKDVRTSDYGFYTAVARSIAGNATSSKITLYVLPPLPSKRSVEDTPSVAKRSIEEKSRRTEPCPMDSPDTVTLVGRVEKQVRQVRSTDQTSSYRVQVKRFIRGSSDESLKRVRTVVFETEPETGEGKLSRNTDYVFRGRLLNKTLIVSRQNVQRHTMELENHIRSC